jgi:hypothetical protein
MCTPGARARIPTAGVTSGMTSGVTSGLTSGVTHGRFVGWITNFIHNRKDPDVNMVRGYLTSTVGRSVHPDRLDAIAQRAEARGSKPPKSGFLTLSSDVLDLPGQSRAGSGELKYTLHSRSHTRPAYTDAALARLRPVVALYVHQMQIEQFQTREKVLSITSGISFNGKSWGRGSGCFFFLADDAAGRLHPHVGTVQRFLAVEVDGEEQFFVEIIENPVLRWQRTVAVVDTTRPSRIRFTHSDHVISLATYADYWEPRFTQYKCVVRVADTY